MRRVHSRDDVPYALINIYLDARVFAKAPKRFRNETVIPILQAMPGVDIAQGPPDADHRLRRRRDGRAAVACR